MRLAPFHHPRRHSVRHQEQLGWYGYTELTRLTRPLSRLFLDRGMAVQIKEHRGQDCDGPVQCLDQLRHLQIPPV